MSKYNLQDKISSDDSRHLTVYSAQIVESDRSVLIKEYSLPHPSSFLPYFRSAIRLSQSLSPAFLDFYTERPSFVSLSFSVLFVYDSSYIATVMHIREGEEEDSQVDELREERILKKTGGLLVEVKEATGKEGIVVVKSDAKMVIEEGNAFYQEAILQAKASAASEKNCRLIDVNIETFGDQRKDLKIYIVMERLASDLAQDLFSRSNSARNYTEEELLMILSDVSEGLYAAQRLKIAHRDVKPNNILLSQSGHCKVTDFGSGALLREDEDIAMSKMGGTEEYTSPEIKETMGDSKKGYDPFKSDVFSLGMSILHLSRLRLSASLPSLSRLPFYPSLSHEISQLSYSLPFQNILSGMLTHSPTQRLSFEEVQDMSIALLPPHIRAEALLQAAKTESRVCEFDRGLAMLQQAWGFAFTGDIPADTATAVANDLGNMLSLHFARFAEAEETLRSAFHWEQHQREFSESAMRLSVSISSVFYHSGRNSDSELASQWTLTTFANTSQSSDNHWTALFYLYFSLIRQRKTKAAADAYIQWKSHGATIGETELAKALKMTLKGDFAWSQGEMQTAERSLLAAKRLLWTRFPTSIYGVLILTEIGEFFLGSGRSDDAERAFLEANQVYLQRFPELIHRAVNLYKWGVGCNNNGKEGEGVRLIKEAKVVYQGKYSEWQLFEEGCREIRGGNSDTSLGRGQGNGSLSPSYPSIDVLHVIPTATLLPSASLPSPDLDQADSVFTRAVSLCSQGSFSEAEPLFHHVEDVYSSIAPGSLQRVANLEKLADLLQRSQQTDLETAQRVAIDRIYAEYHTKSLLRGYNLTRLCEIYTSQGRLAECEDGYRRVEELMKDGEAAGSVHRIENLNKLAEMYATRRMGKEEETVRWEMEKIYEKYFAEGRARALNLRKLAVICMNSRRYGEAETLFQRAEGLYSRVDPNGNLRAYNLYFFAALRESQSILDAAVTMMKVAVEIWTRNQSDMARTHGKPVLARLERGRK